MNPYALAEGPKRPSVWSELNVERNRVVTPVSQPVRLAHPKSNYSYTVEHELGLGLDESFAENCLAQWLHALPRFCAQFGVKPDIDFARLMKHPQVVGRPKGFNWVVYQPAGMNLDDILARFCQKQFATRLDRSLIGFRSDDRKILFLPKNPDPAPKASSLYLCRLSNAPDREFLGATWANLAAQRKNFMSPMQRAMLEAIHFYVFGTHLDHSSAKGWTTRMPYAFPVFKKKNAIKYSPQSSIWTATALWDGHAFHLEADTFLTTGDDRGGPRLVIPIDLTGYHL